MQRDSIILRWSLGSCTLGLLRAAHDVDGLLRGQVKANVGQIRVLLGVEAMECQVLLGNRDEIGRRFGERLAGKYLLVKSAREKLDANSVAQSREWT